MHYCVAEKVKWNRKQTSALDAAATHRGHLGAKITLERSEGVEFL